jgi:hypothetical protein
MSTAPYDDPFAEPDRYPSVSWKGAPPGATITGTVIDIPRDVQARDIDGGKLLTWDDGNPKWNVVISLDINGDKRSLWALKPSALFAALKEAIKSSQAGFMEVGGTLSVTYTGDKPPDKPGKNPARQFTATYRSPDAFTANNPWEQQAASNPQPQQGNPSQQPYAPQGAQPNPAATPAPAPTQQPWGGGSNPQQGQGNDPWLAPQQDEPPF